MLYDNLWDVAVAAFVVSITLSVILYFLGPWANHVSAPKVDAHLKVHQTATLNSDLLQEAKEKKVDPRSIQERLYLFFMGYELNPRIGTLPFVFDIKMCLYLIGSVMVHVSPYLPPVVVQNY
jgi:hypothetical protein